MSGLTYRVRLPESSEVLTFKVDSERAAGRILWALGFAYLSDDSDSDVPLVIWRSRKRICRAKRFLDVRVLAQRIFAGEGPELAD